MDDQQKRLFLALLLCAGVAVVWQMFMVPSQRPPAEGTGAPAVTEGEEPGTGAGTGLGTGQAEAPYAPPGDTVLLLPPQRLQGHDFALDISNAGAALTAVHIQAPEQYVPRDEFGVFPTPRDNHYSFGITLGNVPALALESAYALVDDQSHAVSETAEATVYDQLTYRWSNGQIEVSKVFRADPSRPYATLLDISVRDLSGAGQNVGALDVHLWANSQHGQTSGFLNPVANTIQAACYVNEGLESEKAGSIEGQTFSGPTQWAGVMDRYFLLAAALPSGGQLGDSCRFGSDHTYVNSVLRLADIRLGPNEEAHFEITAYTGPKAEDALAASNSNLSKSVDYGIFSVLAWPMRWFLTRVHTVAPNWGVSIILLTLVVRLLMFPWTHRSLKSMERMRQIQPQLVVLRKKHENDRTKLTEETMKLYKENNVNPLGCLPMLLQMPIYIALYRTIYSSVELYKADFALWINDLSQADPYYILPVLMTATMFTQQLMTPTAVDNPQMKWVMRLMPIFFGVFMLVLPSGLVLYIFVSSLLGILQQYVIRRQRAQATAVASAAVSDPSNQTRQQRRNAARRQS